VRAEISFRLAFAGLIAGAVGIAFAPLFVRWSEVGPAATAFHRLLMALPILVACRRGSRSAIRARISRVQTTLT
jgi:hypothetical protein